MTYPFITPPQFFLTHPDREAFYEKLELIPWEEIRPGVFQKYILHGGKKVKAQKWHCQDCHSDAMDSPMLTVETWKKIAPQDGIVCFPCMEKRLGRVLVLSDIHPTATCPVTMVLRHVLSTLSQRIPQKHDDSV